VTECNDGRKADLFFATHKKTITRICQEEAQKYAFRVRKHEKCLTVEDLMQEALMKVFLQADSFDSTRAKSDVNGFIHFCAKSAIIDALKRYGYHLDATFQEESSEYINPDLLPHSTVQPLIENDAFREQSLASELLDHLHGDKRLVVELKFGVNFYCEHSDEDIAKITGLSRPTVKKEITRALHEMRQYANTMDKGRVAA
jgi:RNA polymerase sigma factor (sigma-70 family)